MNWQQAERVAYDRQKWTVTVGMGQKGPDNVTDVH